ncbi:MAG: hypothetical protein AAF496_07780 [Pseudomonadota bacterium]
MFGDPASFLRQFADTYLPAYSVGWTNVDGTLVKPTGDEIARVKMSPEIGKPIALAYACGQHDAQDILVRASYRQLMGEMYCQYRFVTEALDVRITPYFGEGEPYEDSDAMRADVADNNHLYFLTTTDDAFGSGWGDVSGNWMGQTTGVRIDGYEMLVNDMFRAVHDFFGHAVPGTSFSANGEERAWFCHSQMCSPLARVALTTETRGQNTWVNFGPHMQDEAGNVRKQSDQDWLPPRDRPFADQKNMILSEEISGVRLYCDQMGAVQAHLLPETFGRPEFV